MKTATVRDLRDQFGQVSRWIEEGETVEITKDGKPYAQLIPTAAPTSKQVKLPDFAARMKMRLKRQLPAGSNQSIIDYDRGDR